MKKLLLLPLFVSFVISCKNEVHKTLTNTSNGYTYEYVTNDPTETRVYTLNNGLKVYLSNFENAPRVHVFTAVKAGGKNDPENNTGLAHYLEHIMFKGNKHFGTLNYEKEKPLLDSIENLFNDYANTSDPKARAQYYEKIDAISNKAAKLVIPNEYDKMISIMGGKKLNAYTTEDRTVYTVDIPSNEMERFLTLEGLRFKHIVSRLFHTELEAVYEEKNRTLDSDNQKQNFALYQSLFPSHPYGKQSVIGTIDHLKNPSITEIKNYFNTYYRPNNVAICMSGELDFEKTITLIDKHFGDWKPNPDIPILENESQPEIKEPIEVDVLGPESESVTMGFRFDSKSSTDLMYLSLIDMLLSNNTAGLIDLNLVQEQKVLGAYSYINSMDDYSIHTLRGTPKEDQSLEEVKALLLGEIENIKKGNFENWLIESAINDLKKSIMEQDDSDNANYFRANNMVMAFTRNKKWIDQVTYFNQLSKINKKDIIDFANSNYHNNYAVVYKRNGKDLNTKKIVKPKITKVQLNREDKSLLQESLSNMKLKKLKPKFVDFNTDFDKYTIGDIDVFSKTNIDNDLFTLVYAFDFGFNLDPLISFASSFMDYIGTTIYSPEEFKQELYKLGASISFYSTENQIFLNLSGLSENMLPSIELFEKVLQNPVGSQKSLDKLLERIMKYRSDLKTNKNQILRSQLVSYSTYGKDNPSIGISNEDLKKIKSNDLIKWIKNLSNYPHRILYYGNKTQEELTDIIITNHKTPKIFNKVSDLKNYTEIDYTEKQVFWAHFDMVQTEIILLSKLDLLDNSKAAAIRMFNQYFGSGMEGIVFQEIREAQGLAYSVFSSYSESSEADKADYLYSYIGIQSDKQEEALYSMFDLIHNLPESPQAFEVAKQAILNKIESERITKRNVLENYLVAEKKGINFDIREQIYNEVKTMKIEDLSAFHKNHIKDKPHNILLIGNRNNINFDNLKQYGKVQELSLETLFGY